MIQHQVPKSSSERAICHQVNCRFLLDVAEGADGIARDTLGLKVVSGQTFLVDRQPGENFASQSSIGLPDEGISS